MKPQFAITGMLISAFFALSAFAESSTPKPVTRIDFNKMIDENSNDQQQLQKSVSDRVDSETADSARLNTDKNKVMDFVDVEIGVGEDRPIVDRRFNSVSEPVMAPEFNVVLEKKAHKGS